MVVQYKLIGTATGGYGQTQNINSTFNTRAERDNMRASFERQYAGWNLSLSESTVGEGTAEPEPITQSEREYLMRVDTTRSPAEQARVKQQYNELISKNYEQTYGVDTARKSLAGNYIAPNERGLELKQAETSLRFPGLPPPTPSFMQQELKATVRPLDSNEPVNLNTQIGDYNFNMPSQINYQRPQNPQETIFMPQMDFKIKEDKPLSSLEQQFTGGTYSKDYGDPLIYPSGGFYILGKEINVMDFGIPIDYQKAKAKAMYEGQFSNNLIIMASSNILLGSIKATKELPTAAGFFVAETFTPPVATGIAVASGPGIVINLQEEIATRGLLPTLFYEAPTFGLFAAASKGGEATNFKLKERAMNVMYQESVDTSFKFPETKDIFIPTGEKSFNVNNNKVSIVYETEKVQRGFLTFDESGAISGRQLTLTGKTNPTTEAQAEFISPALSRERIPSKNDDTLIKFVESPLSPGEVEAVRALPIATEIYTEKQKLLNPVVVNIDRGNYNIKVLEEPKIRKERPTGGGLLNFNTGIFTYPESQFENSEFSFDKYSGDYYNRRIKPVLEDLKNEFDVTAERTGRIKGFPIINLRTETPIKSSISSFSIARFNFDEGINNNQKPKVNNDLINNIIISPRQEQKPKQDITSVLVPKVNQDIILVPENILPPDTPRPKKPKEEPPNTPKKLLTRLRSPTEDNNLFKIPKGKSLVNSFNPKYVASVAAGSLKIYGKAPKVITGGEIRPLLRNSNKKVKL